MKLSLVGTKLGTFAVGMAPVALAFDGTSMWVTDATSNEVSKL